MERQHLILIGAISLLVAGNVWYWWPSAAPSAARPTVAGSGGAAFIANDFRLRATSGAGGEASKQVHRNLFQPKITVVRAPPKPKGPPEPPPKTPEQLAEEAARAELSQYKFLGAVFREDKGQALVMRGDEMHAVWTGDKIGRFTVEKIATESIALRDALTNVAGTIPLSGK